MAFQPEVVQYDTGVYQLETTDPVDGGAGAVSNKPLLALANRTAYLKKHIDDLESGVTVIDLYAPKASPTLTGSPTAPTQASGDNSTKLATDAFVQTAVNGGVAVNVAGGSTTTLTQAQYGPAFLILQGAITAAKAVVFPAQSGHWQVVNSTTGAFALTLKTASGTGVVIAPGKSMNIYCDGTNIAQQQTHFSAPWITDGLTASGTVTLSNTLVVNDTANFASTISVGGEVQTTNINSYRHVFGNYGYFWRNDGTNMWLMLTNSQDQYGTYNSLRPMRVQLADGKVVFGNTIAVAGVSTFDSPITANGQININTNGSSTSLLVTDTGVNGANIKLVGNGTATPSKYIRVNAGILQILNDNYSASLMTLNESGSAWFAGNITAVGGATINTTLYVKGDTTLADGGFIFSTNTLQIRPSGMNAGIEIGDTRSGAASTPFIDFHSGATAMDYDFRIIAGGGNGTNGGGYLTFQGASLYINPVAWFYKPVNVFTSGTDSAVYLSGDAGQYRFLSLRTVGKSRWDFGANNEAEGGNNAGTNFYVNRFADDGSYLSTPFQISRATGLTTISALAVTGAVTIGGNLVVTGSVFGSTAGKFSNNTQLSTTAYVERAIGNYAYGSGQITGNITLSANDAGKCYQVVTTSQVTITLPPVATGRTGMSFTFVSNTTGTFRLVTASSSETIGVQNANVTVLTCLPFESIQIVSTDGANWFVTGGSVATRNQAVMSYSAFRAYVTSDQSISAATTTKVIFAGKVIDTFGEFDTSASTFTPKFSGYYEFACALHGSAGGTSQANRNLTLFVNGAERARLQETLFGANSTSIGGHSGLIYLTAGDVVAIYYYTSQADATYSNASLSWFSGRRIM